MAQKKVGELIKAARTKAGLSQEKLAAMIEGLSASEVSKAERGEKDLSQAELKAIAKATGVTQKSLLEAAGFVSSTAKKPAASSAKKPAASSASKKPAAAQKPASSTAKKPAASAAKKPAAAAETKLTAAEKRFLELYRSASAAARKNAEAVLKGEKQVQEEGGSPLMDGLLSGALDILSGIGKK